VVARPEREPASSGDSYQSDSSPNDMPAERPKNCGIFREVVSSAALFCQSGFVNLRNNTHPTIEAATVINNSAAFDRQSHLQNRPSRELSGKPTPFNQAPLLAVLTVA